MANDNSHLAKSSQSLFVHLISISYLCRGLVEEGIMLGWNFTFICKLSIMGGWTHRGRVTHICVSKLNIIVLRYAWGLDSCDIINATKKCRNEETSTAAPTLRDWSLKWLEVPPNPFEYRVLICSSRLYVTKWTKHILFLSNIIHSLSNGAWDTVGSINSWQMCRIFTHLWGIPYKL